MREELRIVFSRIKGIGSGLLRKLGVFAAITGIVALIVISLSSGVKIVGWIDATYRQMRVDAALGSFLPQCEYTADYYGTPIEFSLKDDALVADPQQHGYKTTAYTADGEEFCELYLFYENKHLRLSASNEKHPFYNSAGESFLITTDGSIAVYMNSGSQPYRMVLTPTETNS